MIVYYAYLRGMKPLQHPLTVLWWITIGFNILGFVFTCLGDSASMADAAVAAALPLIYLPLGILIMVWYRGNLEHAGILMIIRILVVSLVPVAFYLLGLLEKKLLENYPGGDYNRRRTGLRPGPQKNSD